MTLAEESVVADVRLVRLLSRDAMKSTWLGESSDGRKVAVHVADGEAATPEVQAVFRERALALAGWTQNGKSDGVLRVHAVDEAECAMVSDLWTVGSVADVTALAWTLDQRIELFSRVCSSLAALHDAGLIHGCLHPSNILLDDDLLPVLSDVGLIDIALAFGGDPDNTYGYRTYASPEAKYGIAMDARTDVFAAGRLLHFLLLKSEPPEEPEVVVPRLDSIAAVSPAGLVRIVRRCTTSNADDRYASMRELMAELANYRSFEMVGVSHPDVRELNLTEDSLKPAAPTVAELSPASAAAAEALLALGAPPPPSLARKPPTKRSEPTAVSPDLSPNSRRVAALVGVGLLVVCLIYAWVASSAPFALRAMVSLLGALPTLLIPVEPTRARMGRFIFGLGAMVFLSLLDPADLIALHAGRRGAFSGDPGSNAAALRNLANFGHTQFADLSLRGVDLSGANLANAVLDRADLTGANLSGARLVGASLVDTHLQGATFAGADLRDTRMQAAIDLDTARCDDRTVFPPGGACVSGHLAFR